MKATENPDDGGSKCRGDCGLKASEGQRFQTDAFCTGLFLPAKGRSVSGRGSGCIGSGLSEAVYAGVEAVIPKAREMVYGPVNGVLPACTRPAADGKKQKIPKKTVPGKLELQADSSREKPLCPRVSPRHLHVCIHSVYAYRYCIYRICL